MRPKPFTPLLVLLAGALLVGCPDNSAPDFDGDGADDSDDCAPEDPDIHPGAIDPLGNGVRRCCGLLGRLQHPGQPRSG